MNVWYKAFYIIKWLWIVGLSPLAYFFIFSTLLQLLRSIFTINSSMQYLNVLIGIISFLIVSYSIFLFFKKDMYQHKLKESNLTNNPNAKFQYGVMLSYIGFLGLVAMYSILLYLNIMHINGFSGILLIPLVLWMVFFGILSASMISDGQYLQDLQSIAKKAENKQKQNYVQQEITTVKQRSKKNILIIIAVPIVFILFIIAVNKFQKYQNTDRTILVKCHNNGRLVLKNLSKTKVYYNDYYYGRYNMDRYNYHYVGILEGDKIIVKNPYVDVTKISKCIEEGKTEYKLIPTNKKD